MNQRAKLAKALTIITEIHASVSATKPTGMTTFAADATTRLLACSIKDMRSAAGYYERASEMKDRRLA